MANVSSAYGEVHFEGNWTEELFEKFLDVFNDHLAGGDYNIEISDIDGKTKTGIIQGNGRWHFVNNLNSMDVWAKYEKPEEWIDLAKTMYELDLHLEIDFADEECGVRFIYRCEGNIVPMKNDEGQFGLKFLQASEENFDYTRENLVAQKLCTESDFDISLKEVSEFLEKENKLSLPGSDSQFPKISNIIFENIKVQLNEQPWTDDPEDILEDAGFFETV